MSADTSLATIADRVREFGITLTATPVAKNPYMEDAWPGASHWRCVLTCEGRDMETFFSQGSAHTDAPTAEDVLNCLVMDAAGFENARNFEDWCGEYGFDTDSRKAERTYNNIDTLTTELKRLIEPLGACAYENLLFHTESL